MDYIFSSYNLIIEASLILIISFFFGELSKRTSIPAVLMLIILGIALKIGMDAAGVKEFDFFPILEVLGIVGLIMIVLEAALELKLDREKLVPIAKAFGIALVGLILSAWVTAEILQYFIEGMDPLRAWVYATPLSILSSAIVIPSVVDLRQDKKEFHVYESTFSDILGIMLFYFLTAQLGDGHGQDDGGGGGVLSFALNTVLTIVMSVIVSYAIIYVFQYIRSSVKLFLLITVLVLLYAIGKKMHLSSLIIILIFGLIIANMNVFFSGRLKKYLHKEKADSIYHGLHVITMETAFVVRTFFFVIFGLTIALSSLASWKVAGVSFLLIAVIYVIRFLALRLTLGSDILPQLFIAPRGLITILLFYAIPPEGQVESFSQGFLLFVILGTGVIMTISMIQDKRRSNTALKKAKSLPVNEVKWKLPQ